MLIFFYGLLNVVLRIRPLNLGQFRLAWPWNQFLVLVDQSSFHWVLLYLVIAVAIHLAQVQKDVPSFVLTLLRRVHFFDWFVILAFF